MEFLVFQSVAIASCQSSINRSARRLFLPIRLAKRCGDLSTQDRQPKQERWSTLALGKCLNTFVGYGKVLVNQVAKLAAKNHIIIYRRTYDLAVLLWNNFNSLSKNAYCFC